MRFLLGLVAFLAATMALADAGHSAHDAQKPLFEQTELSQATRTVEVELGDHYYRPQGLEVKAGEVVRFVFTNKGQVAHEFALGDAQSHAEHQKQMLAMQQMGHRMSHEDASTVALEPGQRVERAWRFVRAGQLEFACNIPGHYQAGMVGKLKIDSNAK